MRFPTSASSPTGIPRRRSARRARRAARTPRHPHHRPPRHHLTGPRDAPIRHPARSIPAPRRPRATASSMRSGRDSGPVFSDTASPAHEAPRPARRRPKRQVGRGERPDHFEGATESPQPRARPRACRRPTGTEPGADADRTSKPRRNMSLTTSATDPPSASTTRSTAPPTASDPMAEDLWLEVLPPRCRHASPTACPHHVPQLPPMSLYRRFEALMRPRSMPHNRPPQLGISGTGAAEWVT